MARIQKTTKKVGTNPVPVTNRPPKKSAAFANPKRFGELAKKKAADEPVEKQDQPGKVQESDRDQEPNES